MWKPVVLHVPLRPSLGSEQLSAWSRVYDFCVRRLCTTLYKSLRLGWEKTEKTEPVCPPIHHGGSDSKISGRRQPRNLLWRASVTPCNPGHRATDFPGELLEIAAPETFEGARRFCNRCQVATRLKPRVERTNSRRATPGRTLESGPHSSQFEWFYFSTRLLLTSNSDITRTFVGIL